MTTNPTSPSEATTTPVPSLPAASPSAPSAAADERRSGDRRIDGRPYGGEAYLPTDAAERKGLPIVTGVLDYFPLALLEVAKVSKAGNDQHNPGEPLHWARGKSMDQSDTAVRHIMERGGVDIDGKRHLAKAAWRILADLQIEMEGVLGLPISRGSSE